MLEKARWIGIISPGRAADILVVYDLAAMTINEVVYADGLVVGQKGKVVIEISPYEYPD
jgi:adenine deaminase